MVFVILLFSFFPGFSWIENFRCNFVKFSVFADWKILNAGDCAIVDRRFLSLGAQSTLSHWLTVSYLHFPVTLVIGNIVKSPKTRLIN